MLRAWPVVAKPDERSMLTPRFLAMPAIALTVIVALAQAHEGAGARQTDTPTVYRAVNCANAPTDSACVFAANRETSTVR
jgi:hypothetical protein